MGYRGLPVRKHSAWDSFRRPRGLDFRVCEIPGFLALKKAPWHSIAKGLDNFIVV